MIHAQAEERHGPSLHVFLFTPPSNKMFYNWTSEVKSLAGSLKALFNFVEGTWKAKKSLKQPGVQTFKRA